MKINSEKMANLNVKYFLFKNEVVKSMCFGICRANSLFHWTMKSAV